MWRDWYSEWENEKEDREEEWAKQIIEQEKELEEKRKQEEEQDQKETDKKEKSEEKDNNENNEREHDSKMLDDAKLKNKNEYYSIALSKGRFQLSFLPPITEEERLKAKSIKKAGFIQLIKDTNPIFENNIIENGI